MILMIQSTIYLWLVNIGDIEVEDEGNLGDNNGATGPHYHV